MKPVLIDAGLAVAFAGLVPGSRPPRRAARPLRPPRTRTVVVAPHRAGLAPGVWAPLAVLARRRHRGQAARWLG